MFLNNSSPLILKLASYHSCAFLQLGATEEEEEETAVLAPATFGRKVYKKLKSISSQDSLMETNQEINSAVLAEVCPLKPIDINGHRRVYFCFGWHCKSVSFWARVNSSCSPWLPSPMDANCAGAKAVHKLAIHLLFNCRQRAIWGQGGSTCVSIASGRRRKKTSQALWFKTSQHQ